MLNKAIALIFSFLLALFPSLAAYAQSATGMYTRQLNSSIGSPTPGQLWNAQYSDGNLYFYNSGSIWEQRTPPKFNIAGNGGPGVNNDNTQGYLPGSTWYDSIGKQQYVCTDGSTGAAVWSQYSNITGGGGGTGVTSVAMTGDNVVFNTAVTGSPITTSGTLVPVLKSQAAYTVLGNFTNGSAAPTFGKVPILAGGTGLSSAPSSGQLMIGTSGGGYALATLQQGSSKISITSGSGAITLDVNPGAINLSTLAGTLSLATQISGTLAATNGGTGSSSAPTSGQIPIGGGSSAYAPQSVTGDVTINSSGVTAIGANKVTNSQMATMVANTIKGNVSGSTAAPSDLTATQLTTLVNPFTSSLSGAVSGSGGGTANYLRADGTWAVPPGGGTGTVTSAAMQGDNVVYNTAVTGSPITTAGTLQPSLKTQLANLAFGNFTGSTAAPSFGVVSVPAGGTGLSSTPTDGQLAIGKTSTGGYQLGTLSNGSNRIGITNGSGTISIDATEGNFNLANLGGNLSLSSQVTGTLPPANGGTGSSSVPSSAQIGIGNGTNYAPQTLSGDVTVNSTGTTTIGSSRVGNSQLATMATATVKGNITGSTANPTDLTATQLTTLINPFTSSLSGAAPASSGGSTNFLRADGTWAVPGGAGSGTVVSSNINEMPYYTATGNAVTGDPLFTNSGTGNVTIGTSGTAGTLTLNGATSGTVQIKAKTTAGTGTIFQLPSANGASADLFINQGSNAAEWKTSSGDVTCSSAGAFTIGNSKVVNAYLANMAAATVKGNVTGGSAAPTDLTATQLTTLVNPFTSSLSGAAPASGGGTSNFLRADGSWAAPGGGGTINSGLSGQMTYYSGTGTTVSGNANANISSGALTLGQNTSVAGSLVLNGSTSGSSTIQVPAAAGTGSVFQLPSGNGSANNVVYNLGSGILAYGSITTAMLGSNKIGAANGGTNVDASAAPNGSLFIGNGSGVSLATLTATSSKISIANGAGSIGLDVAQGNLSLGSIGGTLGLTSQVTGVLPVANGGTGTSTAPSTAQIAIGTAGSIYAPQTMSGDATIAAGGALTVANSAITNAKMANMATLTVKGNVTGGSAAPTDLTATQLTTLINPFSSSLSGAVPASGGGTSNFLRADGTFAAPSAALKYTLSTQSSGFTANGTSGTSYLITASSAIAVTLPASPADGTTYNFTVVSGTGLVTFTANGAETIQCAGQPLSTTMTMPGGAAAGTVSLMAISSGWVVI